MPLRRKKSKNPEVFGYRIVVGTIGSFATTSTIRNANSLSFVGGVPIYERYFLGSEYDVRGYNTRSIGPIAPFDSYVTTRNVRVSSTANGTIENIPGLSDSTIAELISLGTLTGPDGANPALYQSSYRFIGGDTQLLGNFEYRIPIFGPASVALFADIGSVFNLRKSGTQRINSNFLDDDKFVGAGLVTALAARNVPNVNNFNNLFLINGRLLTTTEFRQYCFLNPFGCPTNSSRDIRQVFFRGEAQTNNLVRVDDAAFSKLGDFRSSVGVEFRVQVPIVNVPFRLIYYYNPNAKIGFREELPNLFLPGKRSGFRFTVGRTF
jgi:outer membrane protein insertion porin family